MAVNAGERNIKDTPANRMFYAVDDARALACHTIKICTNEKVFNPQFSYITNQIIDDAMKIYQNAWAANNVLVTDDIEDYKLRKSYQDLAALSCNLLLSKIDLAKRLYHLKDRKYKYWAEFTIRVRNRIRGWIDSDRERYSKKFKNM